MTLFIRKIYQGLVFKPQAIQGHPLVGLVVIVIQLLLMLGPLGWLLGLLLVLSMVENLLFQNLRGALSLIRAILPLIVFLGILSLLFSGPKQTYVVLVRLMVGAVGFSVYFAITNPSDLTRSLEQFHIPPRWAQIPAMALTLLPKVARDAEETFETLLMRGEIRGSFVRWMPKVMAVLVASALYRSEFLSQSLYYRGFDLPSRSHYKKVPLHWYDGFRLIFWLTTVVAVMVTTTHYPDVLRPYV